MEPFLFVVLARFSADVDFRVSLKRLFPLRILVFYECCPVRRSEVREELVTCYLSRVIEDLDYSIGCFDVIGDEDLDYPSHSG